MTGEAPEPGSVEAAAADVLAEHEYTETLFEGGYAYAPGCKCAWLGQKDDHAAHQAERLAAAGLLAAPVPVPVPTTDEDEVEAVADAVHRQHCAGSHGPRSELPDFTTARAVLTAVAPIRAVQLAAAEERGRRAGLTEAADRISETAETGGWGETGNPRAILTGATFDLRRQAEKAAPTTSDDYRTDKS